MIGDDIADLDAFRAAEEMGGYGLKVAGENFSEAEAAFRSPTEVLGWLRSFASWPLARRFLTPSAHVSMRAARGIFLTSFGASEMSASVRRSSAYMKASTASFNAP